MHKMQLQNKPMTTFFFFFFFFFFFCENICQLCNTNFFLCTLATILGYKTWQLKIYGRPSNCRHYLFSWYSHSVWHTSDITHPITPKMQRTTQFCRAHTTNSRSHRFLCKSTVSLKLDLKAQRQYFRHKEYINWLQIDEILTYVVMYGVLPSGFCGTIP